MNSKHDMHSMRHSLAHITANAVQNLWPQAKFGVGPVIENGFYYDLDLGGITLSEDDFAKIESEMTKIVKQNQPFKQFNLPIDQAIEWAVKNKQQYKKELLNDLKRSGTTVAKDLDVQELGLESADDSKVDSVSFYQNGDFTDLCRGPHVEKTGDVGVFKLMRVAGAYWRGKVDNPQMQRLYGVAFKTQSDLDAYLQQLEDAKARDHRKLGKELDLYVTSPLVGAGLPLFTPRGTVLREKLAGYAEQLRKEAGFQRVSIPHITKTDLYKVSGHWDKFGDELFLVKSQETSDEFALKPMNCPHHNQIFAGRPRSYRELPLRYFETTTVYRDEKTGELGGLSRVRSITQDDSHVYCRRDQLETEVGVLIKNVQTLYRLLNMPLKARLSFRDKSDAYLGDESLWRIAQQVLSSLAVESKLESFTVEGEAAFYGPKIDFMATDALGREHQVATIQLDFVMPERFELEYTNETGNPERPVLVHCALLGSIERFLSVYIEHTAGWFPFWLAPEQVRVLTINDSVLDYAQKVKNEVAATVLAKPLRYNELRVGLDDRNETLGRKIRDAVEAKVPVIMIVGNKDAEAMQVSIRLRDKEEKVELTNLKSFLQHLV
ncbi:MAG TPA: threonine--tRNA ligase [Candidatus Saccharimonadales bacterium]|nr:threonine--tRNA ligase [Candidatus Saccharimonadales bacterium]